MSSKPPLAGMDQLTVALQIQLHNHQYLHVNKDKLWHYAAVTLCSPRCKMALSGFDGSPEVTSVKEVCSCGANLICVDLSKVSRFNLALP